MTTISTQSLSAPLRSSIQQTQASLAQVQAEVASGAPADLGLTLGGSTGTAISLRSQVDELNGYTTSNSTATTRLSATATALTALLSSAQKISSDLVTASTAGGDTSALQSTGTDALQSLISGLNTSVGGQSIFAGINTGQSPLANYFAASSPAKAAVDASFTKQFGTSQTSSGASSIDGTDMQSYLTNQFGALFNDSNWQSWSSASNTTLQTATSPTQTLSTSVSANATGFRQIAEGYTILTEFTGSNLSDAARSAAVSTASGLINAGIASLNDLQSTVGLAQSSLSDAGSQITAQVNVLQSNLSSLDSVDAYSLSSQVTTLQTQLQAAYELTSRLQQLSLTNYLTTG